ncbi:MAG: sialate O-acetylesterase [Candidatus Marinimicrobia bacterium]|nr:sialate O-acetylesterase [Candidatus Neomarinimicrobiota bacterium]
MQKRQTFLLIGQSNMAGRGELNRVPPIVDDRIQMFRNGCWQNAVEPLHDDRPDLAGVGLAMSFADELLKSEPDQIIGLIPCAVGFTKIEQWLPGTALYRRAFNAALESGERLNGILWHQGESDSDDEARAKRYREHFIESVQALRRDFSLLDLPFISGELGDFINAAIGFPFSRKISAIFRELEATLSNYACVSAEGLTATADGLHFNAPSLREFGRRYARAYMQLISNRTT